MQNRGPGGTHRAQAVFQQLGNLSALVIDAAMASPPPCSPMFRVSVPASPTGSRTVPMTRDCSPHHFFLPGGRGPMEALPSIPRIVTTQLPVEAQLY